MIYMAQEQAQFRQQQIKVDRQITQGVISLMSIYILLFVSMAVLLTPPANASPTTTVASATGLTGLDEVKSGTLLFKSETQGRFVEAPRLATDISIDITGPFARTVITQRFKNVTDGWVEGVYAFPLPETAAIDTLKMQIGSRFIEGVLKPREEAKKIFEQAKAEGKKASLLEQERPNLFTNSIANIGPGETIVVQIEYQETVRQQQADFSIRIPLVVAPRYNPKPMIVQSVTMDGKTGWGATDPVPDRSRISPPVSDPSKSSPINPVTLTVHLNAGFELETISSTSHKIEIVSNTEKGSTITLSNEVVIANKDFVLSWTAKPGASPTVALFTEKTDTGQFTLAYIMPPQNISDPSLVPNREVIFVIDQSGSMAGRSMDQAKASLQFALDNLKPSERFNIIRFNHEHFSLFGGTVPANQENLEIARAYVENLVADGGTEMLGAMQTALYDPDAKDRTTLRQVIFLTDGAIGNEKQLFDTITKKRGRSRIFTVGIGSAPNSYFMRKAAEFGRGTFTHIGSVNEVDANMRKLFAKLAAPVAVDLVAELDQGGKSSLTPNSLPDLYQGEPVVVIARSETIAKQIKLTGRFENQPWEIRLPLDKAVQAKGISKIWARRKIDDIEAKRTMGVLSYEQTDRQVENIAMEFGLVSRRTSLVAIDVTPSRPIGTALETTILPVNLPEGWDFNAVFGNEATEIQYEKAAMQAKTMLVLASSSASRIKTTGQKNKMIMLPPTATLADLKILAGLFMLLLASLTFIGIAIKSRAAVPERNQ